MQEYLQEYTGGCQLHVRQQQRRAARGSSAWRWRNCPAGGRNMAAILAGMGERSSQSAFGSAPAAAPPQLLIAWAHEGVAACHRGEGDV